MSKKALMVVSFGTTLPDARAAIENLEERLCAAFPGYDFFRAFTSRMVAGKIEKEEGVHIPSPAELLGQLAEQGYEEVRCQSLHVIFGQEYEKLMDQLRAYKDRFALLTAGAPLLWDTPDYLRLTAALLEAHAAAGGRRGVCVHGPRHRAPGKRSLCAGGKLLPLPRRGARVCRHGRGLPASGLCARAAVPARGDELVHLAPLMIVAGDHAQNDLAGDADDSWKSRLLGEDYSVEVHHDRPG